MNAEKALLRNELLFPQPSGVRPTSTVFLRCGALSTSTYAFGSTRALASVLVVGVCGAPAEIAAHPKRSKSGALLTRCRSLSLAA